MQNSNNPPPEWWSEEQERRDARAAADRLNEFLADARLIPDDLKQASGLIATLLWEFADAREGEWRHALTQDPLLRRLLGTGSR